MHVSAYVIRIERKEFSNDPTAEMQEISSSFQGNMLTIQKDVSRLDKESVVVGQVRI